MEGLIHETTIATLVALGSGAVYEVLLRKADEGASLDEMSSFGGTSGGERPARSALTLVLNTSNGTLGSPVPASRSGGINLVYGKTSRRSLGNIHATSPGGELLKCLVGELIDGDSEALSLGIVLSDELEVGAEDGRTKIVLDGRIVFLAVLSLELSKGQSMFALSKGEGASEKRDEE